jgi:hypothetical protein
MSLRNTFQTIVFQSNDDDLGSLSVSNLQLEIRDVATLIEIDRRVRRQRGAGSQKGVRRKEVEWV